MTRPPTRWAAVLFDLDGTLADTVELILESFRHTVRTHLAGEVDESTFVSTIGLPLPVQLRAYARDDAELQRLRETYVAFQRTAHDRMVRPFPGAGDVLEALRRQGTRLAVVTSKRGAVARRTLRSCGLLEAVDLLIPADEVAHPKPHPESVVRALHAFGVRGREREVLFVGDSPYDVRAGRAAGVRTAAALWGPFGREPLAAEAPDYEVAGLPEVLRLRP